ncbi:MAG: universal stress protein [Candidatus Methylarchaceae archaeon HK02M2]|nr:universal stress protein [Candidatus Methylarchaceae archaeon HK02M2]
MEGYKKVLIAVNGKIDVLTEGLKSVKDEKCVVTVLKVVPSYEGDLSLVGVRNIEDVLNGDRDRLISEIEDVAKAKGAVVTTRVEEGDIQEKIVEVAEEEKSDMIIMGDGKQSLVKKVLGMNVTEKVVSQAPCPVVKVKV